MSAKFLKATQGHDMLALHNLTAEMDRRFRDDTDVPEFSVLTAARVSFFKFIRHIIKRGLQKDILDKQGFKMVFY